MKLEVGQVTKSGNFKLEKKITSLNEFWEVANREKSIFARHRMYPTAFLIGWKIKEVNKWIRKDFFWIAKNIKGE